MIVGNLSRSQLSKEQVQVYINEENNRRKSLLVKYIRLCNDAKVGSSLYQSESSHPIFENIVTGQFLILLWLLGTS